MSPEIARIESRLKSLQAEIDFALPRLCRKMEQIIDEIAQLRASGFGPDKSTTSRLN